MQLATRSDRNRSTCSPDKNCCSSGFEPPVRGAIVASAAGADDLALLVRVDDAGNDRDT